MSDPLFYGFLISAWLAFGLIHFQVMALDARRLVAKALDTEPRNCNFVAFAWRYGWFETLLGPLLLLRNGALWAVAWGNLFVSLADVDDEEG